jgi:hypothetical protein
LIVARPKSPLVQAREPANAGFPLVALVSLTSRGSTILVGWKYVLYTDGLSRCNLLLRTYGIRGTEAAWSCRSALISQDSDPWDDSRHFVLLPGTPRVVPCRLQCDTVVERGNARQWRLSSERGARGIVSEFVEGSDLHTKLKQGSKHSYWSHLPIHCLPTVNGERVSAT